MALQDILDAIVAEADNRIATARTQHQQTLSRLREESDRRLLKKKQDINAQREEKKRQMHQKGQAAIIAHRRNVLLTGKRMLLDRLYQDIEQALATQAESALRPFLAHCLQQVKGEGVIRPAKQHAHIIEALVREHANWTIGEPLDSAGGFLFVSEKEEQDFTFSTLVQQLLRPRTETDVARQLFPEQA